MPVNDSGQCETIPEAYSEVICKHFNNPNSVEGIAVRVQNPQTVLLETAGIVILIGPNIMIETD
jgi:hypothetical protein